MLIGSWWMMGSIPHQPHWRPTALCGTQLESGSTLEPNHFRTSINGITIPRSQSLQASVPDTVLPGLPRPCIDEVVNVFPRERYNSLDLRLGVCRVKRNQIVAPLFIVQSLDSSDHNHGYSLSWQEGHWWRGHWCWELYGSRIMPGRFKGPATSTTLRNPKL